jgi:hypothetical protein
VSYLTTTYPSGLSVDWERDGHGNLRAVEFDTASQTFRPRVDTRILADANGLNAFDTAFPQQWADAVYAATQTYPWGFVWCYDPIVIDGVPRPNIFGFPFPVTPEAEALYAILPEELR